MVDNNNKIFKEGNEEVFTYTIPVQDINAQTGNQEVYEKLANEVYQKEKNLITHFVFRKDGKDLFKLPIFTSVFALLLGIKKPRIIPVAIAAMIATKTDLVFIKKDFTEISVYEEINNQVKKTKLEIESTVNEVKNVASDRVNEFKNSTVDKVYEIKGSTIDKLSTGKYYTVKMDNMY